MTSIAIIMVYFGQWPEWINFFIESCKWNRDIDWKILTDCEVPENTSSNVEIIPTTYGEYTKRVSRVLKINFNPSTHYKLCDLKPAFGVLHYDLIKHHDFWGFGDLRDLRLHQKFLHRRPSIAIQCIVNTSGAGEWTFRAVQEQFADAKCVSSYSALRPAY